jgi:translocation and assembly module TamB
MSGRIVAKASVGGKFSAPTPEGEIIRGDAFKVADVTFGDLSGGKFTVDVHKPNIELTNVRAKKGQSEYEVTTARLDFGGGKGFKVDALAATPSFALSDLLSMFNMDTDPRFQGLDARMATQGARVHVALGGEEDKCGGGYIEVHAKTHLLGASLFGESFDSGDADVELAWHDRQAGMAGADVNIASFVLNKAVGPQTSAGTVLGSATIRRGGALSANVVVDNVPLSRISSLGSFASQVDGQVSAVAQVHGNFDDFDHDPGFTVQADVDVTPIRVRGVPLPQSHARIVMTDRGERHTRAGARVTGCGNPIGPPFDRDKYMHDTSSHGEYTVDGELFGNQLVLKNVRMSREKAPHVKGAVQLRGLDLGAIMHIASPPKRGDDAAATDVRGEMWGDLTVSDLPLNDLSAVKAQFQIAPTVLRSGKQTVRISPPANPLVVQNDTLQLPAEGIELALDTPSGFSGRLRLIGGADHLSKGRAAQLRFNAALDTIKLSEVAQYVPKVERAQGTVQGEATVRGSIASPEIAGHVQVAADEIVVHGFTGAMTDVKLTVFADARQIRADGSASFAGGSIKLRGYAPVSGTQIGFVDGSLQATGLRFSPEDGVAATANADLRVTMDPHASGGANAHLPHVTGDVVLTSFEYTRPINLTTDLSGRARRTNVESYDPSQDAITFDVNVRAQSPLKIKNNLADIQLAFDSGTLLVSGTNQRIGLRGDLRSLPGGRFHFRASDFDIRQGLIRFEDPTRIAPNIDVLALTEYRRFLDSSATSSAATTYGTSGGTGLSRTGAAWRITLHAYGDTDNVRVELTSDPPLSQEDIVLLLSVGMTRAEIDQLQASSLGASIALNYLGTATGADRAVKEAIPVIDDFRFGSATTRSGKTDPQLTIGKRLTDNIRASVTTGFSEDRELRSIISWRLNQRLSVEGSYDNINDVAQSSIGNVGVDLRWRLEFE